MANVKLAIFLLVAAATTVPVSSQTTQRLVGKPAVQRRCTSVVLDSETSMLPSRLIGPYLQQRDDFQASNLVLTPEQASADATVTLTRGGERGTRIQVVNRGTGQSASATSNWTDYPGMVALDVMEELRQVCPGLIVLQPKYRPAAKECAVVDPALRSVNSIAACSHTSWMDNRELYEALQSQGKFQQSSIQLLPACSSADATLEITHNLELTLEWNWKLLSAQRETISSGRVIAFASTSAAERIANQVAREIAFAGGQIESPANGALRAKENVSLRNIRSHLVSSDFSLQDSRISLSVDNETVTGRDAVGNVAFTFFLDDLLDVRRRKEWNHPFQLDAPTGLITSLETGATDEEVLGAAAALAIYVSGGALLTQVRTPVHILDLAWQEDGAVKSVSLQIPVRESSRLLRVLQDAGSGDSTQTCGRTPLSAIKQSKLPN